MLENEKKSVWNNIEELKQIKDTLNSLNNAPNFDENTSLDKLDVGTQKVAKKGKKHKNKGYYNSKNRRNLRKG